MRAIHRLCLSGPTLSGLTLGSLTGAGLLSGPALADQKFPAELAGHGSCRSSCRRSKSGTDPSRPSRRPQHPFIPVWSRPRASKGAFRAGSRHPDRFAGIAWA